MSTPSLADRFFVEAMSPAFREDPYLHYERFRGPDPLLRVADTIWFALGHADVTALLRHPGMSTDESHATTEIGQSGPGAVKSQSLLFMDPPDHTRLRNLVARAFTPRRIEGLRAATEAITAELLDAMGSDGGPVDLIQAFAYPLPVRVICNLLGIPEADEAVFTGWSRGIARSLPRFCARLRSTPPSSRREASCAPISASCWRRVARTRGMTCYPGWLSSRPTAIASRRARCCRWRCCCWSRATRRP
jgi:cytochrome P450